MGLFPDYANEGEQRMETQERSKMLGTMEMGKLVPKVSIPIMISMMVQALYNVVDGIFVAKYSAAALTAVSLAYPIQMLMIAVSTGLGVGFNSLISRKLGEKRAEEARDADFSLESTKKCTLPPGTLYLMALSQRL